MTLDPTARRNLELTESLRDRKRRGSLLWLLDKTCTAMGARMLKLWIEQPLLNERDITARQDAIEFMLTQPMAADELREKLEAGVRSGAYALAFGIRHAQRARLSGAQALVRGDCPTSRAHWMTATPKDCSAMRAR